MKIKSFSIKTIGLKLSLVPSTVLLTIIVISSNASGQESTKVKTEKATSSSVKEGMTDGAYRVVDEMPLFPGGDVALLKYIADSTHYPKEAKVMAIQGKVVTRFMVKADGTVSDVTILKGVNPLLDNEAKRVVATLPKFTPGKLNGKDVPVWYMVPINFSLK